MHLLATQSGVIDGGAEAVDLGQDPGDVIFISAGDSELAALARAHDASGNRLSLRLANQMALSHNLSVDTYIERTARHARLIVARILGGRAYWPHGVDQLITCARENDIKLILIPGGTVQDTELTALSSVPAAICERVRQHIAHGGSKNMASLLQLFASLIDLDHGEPQPPGELAKAGTYRPAPKPDEEAVTVVFYRTLLEGGLTSPVDELTDALNANGLNAQALFVTSLKDADCQQFLHEQFSEHPPPLIINTTGFAAGKDNPFHKYDSIVLQAIFAGTGHEAWQDNSNGLSARDLSMNVVLPELDGRVMTRTLSFKGDDHYHEPTQCRIISYQPVPDRIAFTAKLAANWVKLRKTPPEKRKVAIILANYPNRDGRIGNGVGYDTPASTLSLLKAMKAAGFDTGETPASGNTIIERLQTGPTNARRKSNADCSLKISDYKALFADLDSTSQQQITERWGKPEDDPFVADGAFHLPGYIEGNTFIAIQPARGYNIDPTETYHDPALVPPHGYLAFYWWLRHEFGAHAVIHNGKHGNLEWLPGKAVALSANCYPEIAFGPIPQIYPFIVNDPGEGTQAKRRTSAVIIDHLTPPLTRAETYGPYRDLEALIDEYYLASGLDTARMGHLRRQILDLTKSSGLDSDIGLDRPGLDEDAKLQELDTYICELKESQIRDGLHILGESPTGSLRANLLSALARVPRGLGEGGDQSLIRALAADFGFGKFDPLDCKAGEPCNGPRPHPLTDLSDDPWRSLGDTIERLELFALEMIEGKVVPPGPATKAVWASIKNNIGPLLDQCGKNELTAALTGLDGKFVAPGPSGAPTRGRLDVLPTGRNFFSLDNRAVPTPTAWTLGQKSAENMLTRHFQESGSYPAALGLSVWGTSNMRTGGDDIAQALALIGVKPVWDPSSWRVSGYEIIPLAQLARPRVDVTLRISGFFRDAFPAQIELFDRAVRAVGALDEPASDNPLAARIKSETALLAAEGISSDEAEKLAGFRVYGSKPGAYGAGLQAMIDEKLWTDQKDLAAAYITWGAYAYGSKVDGQNDEAAFKRRLSNIEAVVHNQDNREHDVLDSDDYYQFEGGMSAAVETLTGARPKIYHNDHSRPERPVTRTLDEEIGRVVRSRVVNPKWINGVRRHGYKGAFEIAATIDYMFAFAATTGTVKSHHFDLAYDAFIADLDVRNFIAENNPAALAEIADRLNEAIARNLWTPKSNSAYNELINLMEPK